MLAALQADEATRAIPVVVVSADATPRQIEKLMKAGARSYLTKPLEVERFQRVLRQMLEPDEGGTRTAECRGENMESARQNQRA